MTSAIDAPSTCPICGGHKFSHVRPIGDYGIWRCDGCRVQITHPQPTDAALGEIYGRNYFIGHGDPLLEDHASELKRATAARYLQLIARTGHPPGRRLLELGSGHGDFLAEASRAGFIATGIEYSSHACSIIRQRLGTAVEVIQGEVDAVADRKGAYDVCVLNDVIEHVRDPGALLRQIRSLLAPGGALFIATPSIDSWSARLLGSRWMEYKEEHLTYFGPRQLMRLLDRSGFATAFHGSGRKVLSVDYITRHFQHYPVPGITQLMTAIHRLLPTAWRRRQLSIVASGIVVVARRRET